MATCLKCGGQGEYSFRVLEVLTLHIRDMAGEKRVQALGRTLRYDICAHCARERLEEGLRPGKRLWKKLTPYLAVLLLGATVLATCWNFGRAFQLLGLAGIFCGAAGGVAVFRAAGEERKVYRGLSEENALQRAAWDCLLEAAPRKEGENDLTYIPINETTMALKNGDLAVTYDLLPAIAKQAWDRLHGEETPAPENAGTV